MEMDDLIYKVIGAAFTVHGELGHGFLEKVYERALVIELRELGLTVHPQFPIPVSYRDQSVGNYIADLFVNEGLIVELKADLAIAPAHEVQLVNYLKGTGIEHGLLLNFGERVVYKRKFKTYRPPSSA